MIQNKISLYMVKCPNAGFKVKSRSEQEYEVEDHTLCSCCLMYPFS